MSRRRNRFPLYAPAALEARLNPSPVAPAVPLLPAGLIGSAFTAADAPPGGGTAPAPPSGSGDPPIEDPAVPIGPAVPAMSNQESNP